MEPYNKTLPLLYETLKLQATMQRMIQQDDCNEDLVETAKSFEKDTFRGLLNLLSLERAIPDDFHQPLRIVDELVSREIGQLAFQDLEEPESLYHLMNSKSTSIQMAAYKLLHTQIPLLQVQLSMDVVIEKKVAQLPDELLSLILESPQV